MKYLCLVYMDEEYFYNLSAEESEALWAEGEALAIDLRRHPGFIAADALEPTRTAMTLRTRAGGLLVTDGPFAETREQLAGFVLIEAANLDEAIKVAARVPAARYGSVEVRPTREMRQPKTTGHGH